MKNPTPIDQLPSFVARVKAAREQDFMKWLPYAVLGMLVIAAFYIAHKLDASSALDKNPALVDENEEKHI
jgi:hypothetical protein